MMYRVFILVLLSFMVSLPSYSQKKRTTSRMNTPNIPPTIENLPRIPVDTIPTNDPDTKIITFTNNTWEYYRPSMNRFDELEVYTKNWDTLSIFAYKNIELADIPHTVNLKIVDDDTVSYKSPIQGSVRSKYGLRRRRNHNGVDIPLKLGEPIYSTFDGKVRWASFKTGGFGNLVIVRHKNGLETWYAHLTKVNVKVNDYVKAGQVIGFGGSTGRSTGPHLHYEVRYCDQTFDPEFLIDFESGILKYTNFALDKRYFNIHSRASEILEDDDEDAMMQDNLLVDADSLGVALTTGKIAVNEPKVKETQVKAAGQAQYHTVKKGETLGHIALKYGTSVTSLCKLNNISRTKILSLGTRLRVR